MERRVFQRRVFLGILAGGLAAIATASCENSKQLASSLTAGGSPSPETSPRPLTPIEMPVVTIGPVVRSGHDPFNQPLQRDIPATWEARARATAQIETKAVSLSLTQTARTNRAVTQTPLPGSTPQFPTEK